MPDEATTKCLLQSLMTFLGGGLVGTILGHFLAIGRDARNRKHANQVARQSRKTSLLSFLNVWASEVAANRRTANASNVLVGVSDQFDIRRLELISEATPIESDFGGDELTRFKEMIDKITGMTPGSVGSNDGRQNLLKAIRDLMMLLKEN